MSNSPSSKRTRARRLSVRNSVVRMAPTMSVPTVLAELGVDAAGLLAEFGLTPAHFDEPERAISFETRSRLLARCAHVARCPHFGLLVGQRGSTSVLGPVGFLMQSAPNLRVALGIGTRQFRLHNPGGTIAYTESGSFCTFSYTILGRGHVGDEQALDMALAGMFIVMRTLCGNSWQPTEVHLAHSRPRNLAPFRRLFQAPLVFDSEETALVFRSQWLDRPLATSDPFLHVLMKQYVRDTELVPGEELSVQLRRVLPSLITRGHATPAKAARRLDLGVRTLNRRLEEEGLCFSQLHDESRYSLARQLLRFTRMPVGQVASSLAYANASAFTRAFRRWSGESPARWRGSM
jgi:AraC-like DNA-binding protein